MWLFQTILLSIFPKERSIEGQMFSWDALLEIVNSIYLFHLLLINDWPQN